jgi:hypothetical protein
MTDYNDDEFTDEEMAEVSDLLNLWAVRELLRQTKDIKAPRMSTPAPVNLSDALTIEDLRAEVERLRRALRPIRELLAWMDRKGGFGNDVHMRLRDHIASADAALSQPP